MKPVFLIGYMGCGKTTLGVVLARQMGLRFIDLDDYIEQRQGATINEIFATSGEARFRELETEALNDIADMADVIIACGGGTPCHGDNMALMNRVGTTVWLTTSPERITARLLLPEQKSKRPKVAYLPDSEVLPICSSTPPISRLAQPPSAQLAAWQHCSMPFSQHRPSSPDLAHYLPFSEK